MVKRLLRFFHREISSLHQAAYLLGIFAFGSQLLALIRDRLLAHTFGASQSLDVYFAAFRVPDFIFVFVGSLVSISVLIPFLAERLKNDFEDAQRFVNHIFSFFFGSVLVVSVLVFLLLPWILDVAFPGFRGEEFDTLVTLSRILLFSPILLGISNLFGSITQIHKRFFIYAMSPLLYNGGIIFGVAVLAPVWGISGVVFGVVAGAALHGLIQVPYVVHAGLFPRPRMSLDWSIIRRVLALSFPRTITLGSTHFMLLVFLGVASLMDDGSIAVFNFSYNLQNVPLSIVGVSYSLAAFPTLSHLFVGKKHKKFMDHIITAARHIIFWTVPAAILFIVLRAQIVRTILGSGRFDWADTRLTAAGLALFCVSIVFQGIVLLFVRGYYSAGETRKPLVISLTSAAAGVLSAGVLLWVYQHASFFRYFTESLLRVDGVVGTEVLMLVGAFVVAQVVNAILLMGMFQRDFGPVFRPLRRAFFDSLSAGVFAGAAAWVLLNIIARVFPFAFEALWQVFLQGFVAGLGGVAVGVMLLIILENNEIAEVWSSLRRKLWERADVVGPDPDVV